MFGARPRESTHTPRVLGRAEFARDRAPVGMLAATQELTRQFSPRKPSEGLQVIRTNTFTLHHLETLSGLRFVLNTDNDAGDLRPLLRHIYGSLWCVRGALRRARSRPAHRARAARQGRTHRQIAALRSEGVAPRRIPALRSGPRGVPLRVFEGRGGEVVTELKLLVSKRQNFGTGGGAASSSRAVYSSLVHGRERAVRRAPRRVAAAGAGARDGVDVVAHLRAGER
jgi:hypothetical protein